MPISSRKRQSKYSITFSVPKKAGAVSFAIAGIAIYLFYSNINKKVVDETLATFSVAVTGAAAAVTSAFYVGSAIQKNSLSRKEDRAIQLVSVWNGEYYSTLRRLTLRPMRSLLRDKSIKVQDRLIEDHLEKNPEVEEQIVTILNFLEQVAMCVNGDLVDEEIIQSYFGYIIPRLAQIFSGWIYSRQRERSNTLYEEFQILGKRWEENLRRNNSN